MRAARNVGRLLAIGGNEDPDEDDMCILPRFVEMCGGYRCGEESEAQRHAKQAGYPF